MDRPMQDANEKFERGIFSGPAGEKTEPEKNIEADHYFDNACCQPKTFQDSPAGQEGDSVSNTEGRQNENLQHEDNGNRKDSQEQNSWKCGRPCQEDDIRRENYDWQRGEAAGKGNSSYRQDYEEYRYGSYKCRHCTQNRKMSPTALVFMLLTVITVFAVAITIAFLVTVFCLVKVSSGQAGQSEVNTVDEGDGSPYIKNPPKGNQEGTYGEIPIPGIGNSGEYYGEITDAIRTDLDYTIEWENYEYEGNNDNVVIAVDYPVVKGDIPNLEAINDMIDDETEYFEEYYKEYSKYMMPDERFMVYSEGYVTYMDQEVMSVVFCEMIYTDYWTDYGLYCLNIDVESGMVLDNNSIMEIDDEFAVDFRKRCSQQNGAVSDLDYMTDQEIVYYLTSGGTSILFYTPMGMEVGMNFGEYYVTVTYKDYEKFLQKY